MMDDDAAETPAANFAERYEATLAPVIFVPWARELMKRAGPRDGEHILDLGCGTGIVTREIAKSGIAAGSLTGVDHSSHMLEVARKKAAENGSQASWVEADAGRLPFEDDRFDLAFCQQALQFFPNRPEALRELKRVLKPGGRAAFCVQRELECNPLLKAQAIALERNIGQAAGDAVRAICSLSDADEIRDLFENAGFSNVVVESVSLLLQHPDGGIFADGAMAGMHTGDKLSRISDERRQRCIDTFLNELGDCFDGKRIRFAHVSNVIVATA